MNAGGGVGGLCSYDGRETSTNYYSLTAKKETKKYLIVIAAYIMPSHHKNMYLVRIGA